MTQPPFPDQPQQPYQPQQYQPVPGPPQQQPGAHVPPGRSSKPKRFGWLAVAIAAVAGLAVGSCSGVVGASAGSDPAAVITATPSPGPTVTVYQSAEPASEPTEEPTDEASDEPAGFKPKKSDFVIGVKTLSKECFGSAGCNLTFRINPEYVGDQDLPDSGTIEVTYEVRGPEDTITNTFTIEGGSASYDKEEDASTPSSSTKLKVKVVDVTYDE